MSPLQLTVREILRRAHAFEWSVQGFGLLRLYLGREGRLHVWAPCLTYPGVSTIHDHSWDLRSEVVVGHLNNRRYVEGATGTVFWKRKLVTGYDTRFVEPPSLTKLTRISDEHYFPCDRYEQQAHEVHETLADPYTVTLMRRHEDENGEATVFWPFGEEWGTAKPRPATADEVRRVAERALALFP
jgi:hypothetical protein